MELIELNAATFKSELGKNNSTLIDVRTEMEYENGSIPNSILMDCSKPGFAEEINKLDKSKQYYLYCHSGARSYQVGQYMVSQGFEKVAHLEDGIISWRGDLK